MAINTNIICKKCGSKMVIRINRKTGERFLGCSNFPECRYTEHLSIELMTQEEYKKYLDDKDMDDYVKDRAEVWALEHDDWGDIK